jgi:hypothetical protein
MWKGGDSNAVEPPHIVTETYAEFPWGSCPRLRLDYQGSQQGSFTLSYPLSP